MSITICMVPIKPLPGSFMICGTPPVENRDGQIFNLI